MIITFVCLFFAVENSDEKTSRNWSILFRWEPCRQPISLSNVGTCVDTRCVNDKGKIRVFPIEWTPVRIRRMSDHGFDRWDLLVLEMFLSQRGTGEERNEWICGTPISPSNREERKEIIGDLRRPVKINLAHQSWRRWNLRLFARLWVGFDRWFRSLDSEFASDRRKEWEKLFFFLRSSFSLWAKKAKEGNVTQWNSAQE